VLLYAEIRLLIWKSCMIFYRHDYEPINIKYHRCDPSSLSIREGNSKN